MPALPSQPLDSIDPNAIRVLLTGFGVRLWFSYLFFIVAHRCPPRNVAFLQVQRKPFLACGKATSQRSSLHGASVGAYRSQ